jgi:hypothetical protein
VKAHAAGTALAGCALCGFAALVAAQEKPLRRSFQAGAVESFRVEVSLRTEIRGVKAETIGAKTYVKSSVQAAEGTLRWTAVRRVERVDEAGFAVIEESLERPAGDCPTAVAGEEESPALRAAMEKFCGSWKGPRDLHYREGNDGLMRDYPKGESAGFEEMGCSLIELWSRHALRPSAILPAGPLRIGERHEKKSPANLPGMSRGESSETTEWLAAARGAAVVLHVVQHVTNQNDGTGGAQHDGHARQPDWDTFFAESLATLSTLDGSLSDATRSASCAAARILDPVEGLPEPPRFSFKLSVTVTIHRIS